MPLPAEQLEELDWVKLRQDMDAINGPETFTEKFSRKFGENPLVPVGCLATAGALGYGLYSFKNGNRKMSQYMMRLRVFAQGFTIIAFVTGLMMTAYKK